MGNDDIERALHARRGSPFLNTDQAAAYLSLSPRQLKRLRRRGEGPVFRRHCRFVQYHIDDLDAWSREHSARGDPAMTARTPRGDLPLLAWGEARFAHRQRKLHHLRLAVLGGAALVLLVAPPVYSPAPRLVWNASASAPIGLYWVWPGDRPARGEMVIAWPPVRWRRLAAERHYLPANVPLVKRAAAVTGDLVCASGPRISVEGKAIAIRQRRDPSGRNLPWWQGCRRLGRGEYLLLMDAAGSFDGRYFGVSRDAELVGRARLLWRR